MKILRVVGVLLAAGLIVLGIRQLSQQTQETGESPLFASLRERMQDDSDTTPIVSQPDITTPDQGGETVSLTDRIRNELVPQLSYGSLTANQYEVLLEVGGVYADESGDTLIVQYCDYSMTYCRQAQREGALIAYQDALKGNAGYMLKPVLLESNPASQIQHHALLCAQKLGNESQVNRMHALLFQLTEGEDILERGQELGIPAFESCLIEESSRRVLRDERRLAGELFQISQLPSYVFVDTRSLDWTIIPGLYDESLVTTYLSQTRN